MRDELRPYVGKLMICRGWKTSGIKDKRVMLQNCKLWLWDGNEALEKVCAKKCAIKTDHLWMTGGEDRGFEVEAITRCGKIENTMYIPGKTVGVVSWYRRNNGTTDLAIDNHPILCYEQLLFKLHKWSEEMRGRISPPNYHDTMCKEIDRYCEYIDRQGMNREYGEGEWGPGYILSENENLDYAKAELLKAKKRHHENLLINEKALSHSKLQEINRDKDSCNPTFATRAKWAGSYKRSKPKPFGTLTKHGRNYTRAMGKDRTLYA